jgi:putative membrane protein
VNKNKLLFRTIIGVSVAIPIVVAALLYTPFDLGLDGAWIKFLPTLNAILNSATAAVLVLALFAIRSGKVKVHSSLMLTGLVLGSLFLVSYVLYHANSDSVIYGDVNHNGSLEPSEVLDAGVMRSIYIFTLLSHIALSIVVVPFVLLAFYYALTNQIPRHRKIVKFTFPVWLYVSVTGVLVYLMISPYYL